jgi:hypothetical protein
MNKGPRDQENQEDGGANSICKSSPAAAILVPLVPCSLVPCLSYRSTSTWVCAKLAPFTTGAPNFTATY